MRNYKNTLAPQIGLILLAACASKPNVLGQKYPYARITPDHGILNENDLWISGQEATPLPFTEDSLSYPYWQCLPVTDMRASCTNSGDIDEDKKTPLAEFELKFESDEYHEIYVGRRAIPRTFCDKMVLEWMSLSAGEKYACIAGSYTETGTLRNSNGRPYQRRMWEYDRFKTRKGCVSYFDDYCDPNYWKAQSRN